MRGRGRVRPSKAISALAFGFSIVFVFIGIFVVVPNVGGFGVLWTLLAAVIAIYYAINVFSDRGVADEVIEFDTTSATAVDPPSSPRTAEERLKNLDALKQKGLITAQEYEEQRKRILDDL